MKGLKIGAAVLAAAVAVVLGLASRRPDSFRVERRVVVSAPAARVFPLVNDLRRQQEWSPWDKKDPAMRRAHGGAPNGKGATYEWEGNSEVGAGRMEIVESVPNERVAMDLHFLKPFEARNVAELRLEPKDGGTEVAWSISGPMPFVSKFMCLFMDMDEMIGGDFEKGLADLKALAEGGRP